MKSKLHDKQNCFNEDHARRERTLIPELIYCENKSIEQIVIIAKKLYLKQKLVLGTRCPINYFSRLKKTFPGIHIVQNSHCFRIGTPLKAVSKEKVGIVSAGTTDIAVCEEAALVLESLGISVERVYDVGVAGIHRLFAKDDRLKICSVLIIVAGMEGALPSVVAGLYPQPIIAIPTSIGYGTALSGFTALFAMLTGCAPGVTVVNIDNGVGAAAAAYKIISFNKQLF
jgi:pyridinium-3,5-biscarboxylic acid mononucleotide synthase